MTKRNEILARCNVENGIIVSPGKFEGEAIYMPYFFDLFLDGVYDLILDGDDGEIIKFKVCDEDKKEFPELNGVKSVAFRVTDFGFVVAVPC